MRRRLARAVVRAAALAVPPLHRDRFSEEWLAEIACEPDARKGLRRSLGVFADAAALRRLYPRSSSPARLSAVWVELRYAVRALIARPGTSAATLLTLCVGIGATTAMFSLLHAVLIRPLDYPDPERLVKVTGFNLEEGNRQNLSPADFYDLASESDSIEVMGAHGWVGFFTITGEGSAERVAGSNVTFGFLDALGVHPQLGRLFSEEDDTDGAARTVILTDGFWKRRFGGDPDVVGRKLEINTVPHEIVGVLGSDYRHPEPHPEREPAIYVPYRFEREPSRSGRFIRAVGRLAEGADPARAQAELATIAKRLEETHPESNTGRGVLVTPLKESVVGESRAGLVVLFGAVVSLLLIGCVNIANLQLASGSRRRQELAIKSALGAGRGRLVAQLAVESLALALAGGLLGLGIAFAARDLIAVRVLPRADAIEFAVPVLLFTAAVSVAAAVVTGVLPAMALASGDLRRESRRAAPRRLLIAAEVALALPLLVGAGLFARSLSELRTVEPGFEPSRVLSMQLALPLARYEEGEQIPFYQALYAELASVPGVESVGAINILPLSGNYSSDLFQIDERPVPPGEAPAAEARSVNPHYFEAMEIPLLRGRGFDERDREDTPPVVVVSETMASRFWPGEDPLGKRITYNRALPAEVRRDVGGPGSREIVGIVGDVKHFGLDDGAIPMFYTPQTQQPSYHTMSLVVRTSLDPDSLARTVRAAVSEMDENVPLYAVRTLEDVIDHTVAVPELRTYLIGLFAALSLALAALGVYAVIGVSVSQKTREIGIRTALGARGDNLVAWLLKQQLMPVVWGLAAGLVGAVLLSRYLESLLFNVTPNEPAIYVLVTATLAAAALLAAAVPVARALRVDPVHALRTD